MIWSNMIWSIFPFSSYFIISISLCFLKTETNVALLDSLAPALTRFYSFSAQTCFCELCIMKLSNGVCVCVCVCVYVCVLCVCVCACVCVFTSIHHEGFICLDQLGHQGTDQRCYVEGINFLCQISSLLI